MKNRRTFFFVFVLNLTIGCDHATKVAAVNLLEPSSVFSVGADVLRLQLVHNPGAFLSFGANLPASLRIPLLLTLMPVAALAASVLALRSTTSRTLSLLAAALLAGGGLSNWLDRLIHDGLVIDFVSLGVGPFRTGIFNVADLAVVAGVLLLAAPRPKKLLGCLTRRCS